MDGAGPGRTRLELRVPTRSLIGYRSEMLTDTRGTGIMAATFAGYGAYLGPRKTRPRGVLIVMETGETYSYSLGRLQDRGILFIGEHVPVYGGQILGEHSRDNDLEVNPLKGKKLTNVRAAGKDEAVVLTPPLRMSLEQAIAYIDDDELVEVTPRYIRLRKRFLDAHERKRQSRLAAG